MPINFPFEYLHPKVIHVLYNNPQDVPIQTERICLAKLKFHSDANWQFEALEFVNTQGYCATSYPNTCEIENDDKSYYNISQGYTRKEAIFEALWQFSQYLKLKINRII